MPEETDAAPATTGGDDVTSFARRCGLDLLRFAYLLCGDRQHAEDLVQDVLFNMHRRFPDRLSLENPVGYARRALANANISRARKASSTEVVVPVVPESAAADSSDPADRDLLWQALRRLPVRQRTVLVLRYYDAPDKQIAEAIGARLGTVRSLASRALAALCADPSLKLSECDDA